MEKIIWGIDPGSAICGVSELFNGSIGNCFNKSPKEVYGRILGLSRASRFDIVIEDVFPYSNRLTPQIIETCKLIGELTWRFKNCTLVNSVNLIPRNTVKKWIFDTCPEVCTPRIDKKIQYKHDRNLKSGKKGLIKQDGEMRKASFNWVDDRIVIAALKEIYQIPTPKPGKPGYYGLTGHNWQSLAAVTAWQALNANKSAETQ